MRTVRERGRLSPPGRWARVVVSTAGWRSLSPICPIWLAAALCGTPRVEWFAAAQCADPETRERPGGTITIEPWTPEMAAFNADDEKLLAEELEIPGGAGGGPGADRAEVGDDDAAGAAGD